MAYATKKKLSDNSIVPLGSNLYGTCGSASATVGKTVTMPDFNVLVSGVTIHVQFTHKNTASNPTLKVGSTSAVPIKRNGSLEGIWEDGSVISFTYDGTNWVQNDADVVGDSGKTYTFSIDGHTLIIVDSDGATQTLTLPDDDTKYGLSISGNTISLVPNGSGSQVTIPDDDTTYTMSISGHTLTLTPSSGTAQSIILPDDNVTYSLSKSGSTITLTGSDGSTSSVADSDTNNRRGFYGTCSTAAATVGKVITLSNTAGWELVAGTIITVKFTNTNTANNPTFNVNSSGAKPVWYNTAAVTTSDLNRAGYATRPQMYVYDGTYWIWMGMAAEENTTYSVMSASELSTGTATTARTMSAANTKAGLLDLFYPVGSYYETSNANFNPSTAWGGTWSKLGEGTVLMSGGGTNYTVGTTYGDNTKSYTPSGSVSVTVAAHTLTKNEIPSHSHGMSHTHSHSHTTSEGGNAYFLTADETIYRRSIKPGTSTAVTNNYYGASAIVRHQFTNTNSTPSSRDETEQNITGGAAHTHGGSTGSFTGTAATLNVMQKSLAVYIWHRTA